MGSKQFAFFKKGIVDFPSPAFYFNGEYMGKNNKPQLIVKKTYEAENKKASDWLGVLNEETLEMIEYIAWCQRTNRVAYAVDILDYIAPETKGYDHPQLILIEYLHQPDSLVEMGYVIDIDGKPSWIGWLDDTRHKYEVDDETLAFRIQPNNFETIATELKI